MKSKALNYFFIVLATTACSDTQEVADPSGASPWAITWQTEGHVAYGTIFLSHNNEAEVVIEEPDQLFFFQPQRVHFNWKVNKGTFTLIRKDNNFSMDYNIIKQSHNYYELRHADDLIVKIFR